MADERGSEVVGSPGLVSAVPAGLKSTFSKLFGSSWTSNETPDSPAGSGHGGGLIAAFRAMMPKSGSGAEVLPPYAPESLSNRCLHIH